MWIEYDAAEIGKQAFMTQCCETHTERGDCAQDEAAKGLFLLETEGFKSAYMLDGGMRAWHDAVLYPVKAPGIDPVAFEKQVLVAKYFGGAPRTASATTSTALAVPAMPASTPAVTAPTMPAAPAVIAPAPQSKKKKEGC